MIRLLSNTIRMFGELPPYTTLGMPSLSPTMTTGIIRKWLKKEGDKVKAGEVMFEVETDKATLGFEVQDEVFVAKILVEADSAPLPLGHPVAILVDKKDRIPFFKDYVSPAAQVSETPTETPKTENKPETKLKLSPAAHNMVEAHHIDPVLIKPSGPKGLILKEDVASYLETHKTPAKPASTLPTPEPALPAPKAEELKNIQTRPPRFSVSSYIKIDKAISLVGEHNLNAFLIKTAAISSTLVPETNSKFFPEFTRFYDYVDVQAYFYDKGLIKTYFISDAHTKRSDQIEESLRTESTGKYTFSVTFAGAHEVQTPSSACLLTAGPREYKAVAEDRNVKSAEVIKFTLNCDHRVVDGAVAASWLQKFQKYVENPASLL
jgi:pyruvate dehydrogenase E2 component (dihydrolipoamide acetyltransferase)